MKRWWNDTDMEKQNYTGKKPVPVPLDPLQIPHGLACDINVPQGYS
jgi:hypothetical protein